MFFVVVFRFWGKGEKGDGGREILEEKARGDFDGSAGKASGERGGGSSRRGRGGRRETEEVGVEKEERKKLANEMLSMGDEEN